MLGNGSPKTSSLLLDINFICCWWCNISIFLLKTMFSSSNRINFVITYKIKEKTSKQLKFYINVSKVRRIKQRTILCALRWFDCRLFTCLYIYIFEITCSKNICLMSVMVFLNKWYHNWEEILTFSLKI